MNVVHFVATNYNLLI